MNAEYLKILRDKKTIGMIFVISILYCLIYILNYDFPLFLDDWTYHFIFGTNERVNTLADIFQSQYNHYFMWGGRSVVHLICQILFLLDFWLVCLFNAAAYVGFVYLMYSIVNRTNEVKPVLFLLINAFLWFFQPAFCQTVLWKTGASNYLWGSLIVLLFIYPYYRYYLDKKVSDKGYKAILFFFAGIVAGWTNENSSVALVFFIFVSICLYRIEKIKIPKWVVLGFIGAIIGCLILLLAPGNFVRVSFVNESIEARNITRLELFLASAKDLLITSLKYMLPLILGYIICLLIYRKEKGRDIWNDSIVRSSLLFLSAGLIAFFALMGASISEKRAMFIIIIFLIIPLFQIYSLLDFRQKYLKALNVLFVSVFLLFFVIDYTWKYNTINIATNAWKNRELMIQDYKNRGVDTIVFTDRYQIHIKYGIQDLDPESQNPVNLTCSKYYGFKWMKVEDSNIKQIK